MSTYKTFACVLFALLAGVECTTGPARHPPSTSFAPAVAVSLEEQCVTLRNRLVSIHSLHAQWMCKAGPHGTWAAHLSVDPEAADTFTLRIVYSPRNLARPESSPVYQRTKSLISPVNDEQPAIRLSSVDLYDFDDDGIPEFLVKVIADHSVFGTLPTAFLSTVHSSTIEEYAPARELPIDELRDVDLDGRPDLILAYSVTGAPLFKSCALPRVSYGFLRQLAHTLPDGHFSLDDRVAVEFAKKECPVRPSLGLPPLAQGSEVLHAARCLRLWGVPARQIIAQFEQLCKRDIKSPCSGACGTLQDALYSYAFFTPPLTLHE